jgi:hypothetical protein
MKIVVFSDITPCSLAKRYPYFRRNLLPPSSDYKSALKLEAAGSSETFITFYQTARRHILTRSNVDKILLLVLLMTLSIAQNINTE